MYLTSFHLTPLEKLGQSKKNCTEMPQVPLKYLGKKKFKIWCHMLWCNDSAGQLGRGQNRLNRIGSDRSCVSDLTAIQELFCRGRQRSGSGCWGNPDLSTSKEIICSSDQLRHFLKTCGKVLTLATFKLLQFEVGVEGSSLQYLQLAIIPVSLTSHFTLSSDTSFPYIFFLKISMAPLFFSTNYISFTCDFYTGLNWHFVYD